MFGECPHCHRRVLALPNGECPSCHKNTNDTESANTDETMLTVLETTKFPDRCCNCNEPTTRRQKLTRTGQMAGVAKSGAKGSSDGILLLALIFNPIVALFAYLASSGSRGGGAPNTSKLTVFVPRCRSCERGKELDVAMVDLEHHRFGIIVHRAFAASVEEMNRR